MVVLGVIMLALFVVRIWVHTAIFPILGGAVFILIIVLFAGRMFGLPLVSGTSFSDRVQTAITSIGDKTDEAAIQMQLQNDGMSPDDASMVAKAYVQARRGKSPSEIALLLRNAKGNDRKAVISALLAANGGSASSGSTGSPSGASGTSGSLTEAQVRVIATDVANKAVAANPAITSAQVKDLIDKAVAEAMALSAKTGGLTETQVRALLAEALKSGTLTTSQAATCNVPDFTAEKGKEYDVAAGCNIKGDVSIRLPDGSYQKQYVEGSDGTIGNIVSCPQGCHIRADFGANVGPRTVPDLTAEMQKTGCVGGCKTVTPHVINACGKDGCGNGGKAPSPQVSAQCEPEIKLGDKRVVAAGCVVVGDVLIRQVGSSQDFKPVFDNLKDTGTVQQLTQPMEVWNLQGASVMPAGSDLSSAVQATKIAGCGTGYGCPAGILDWSGKRLDQ